MVTRDYGQNNENKILLAVWHDDYAQVDEMSERIKGDKHEEEPERCFSCIQFLKKYF